MRRFQTMFILIVSMCILLCGCRSRKEDTLTPLNLTQKVCIDCHYRQNHLLRTYTDSDKIDVIFKYLHRLSPIGQLSKHPEQTAGDRCEITVYLWNGSVRSYALQNKEYLRKNSGDWYAVDWEKANIIYHLVNHIESD